MSHTEKLNQGPQTLVLNCGRIGRLEVSLSAHQRTAAMQATGADCAVSALSTLLAGGTAHFEALSEGRELAEKIPSGRLYLHVPALGSTPLSVRFDLSAANNAEELLETDRTRYASRAHLVASALNTGREPLQVARAPQTAPQRG